MSGKRITGIVFDSISLSLIIIAIVFIIYSGRIDSSFLAFVVRVICVISIFWGMAFGGIGALLIIKGKTIIKQPPSDIAINLIKHLPPSATPLTRRNKKKMYRLFPVPSDYDILWAEVQKFGNHPAGIIITNEALILKSPKSEIKKHNKEIKKQNKGKKKKDKKAKIPYVYRLIPWQYFSPEEYKIEPVMLPKDKEYSLALDGTTVFHIKTPELYEAFKNTQQSHIDINKKLENIEIASVNAAINTINVQPTIYMAKNGAGNTNKGHGIIAEDVGTILDKLRGTDATVVGRDNAPNGADKHVNINGIQTAVQCKYCASAYESVDACFGNADGLYRYYDLNGNPMKLEVPKDQYYQAIDEMKIRIANGNVPGVSDPEKAVDIIRKGNITYDTAKNIAEAGTIESIVYDTATASVRCLSVFGISFLFTFAQVFWETKDAKQAVKSALITGAKIYGLTVFGSVVSSQLVRQGIENLFFPMMKNFLDQIPNSIIEKMAVATKGVVNPEAVVVNGTRDYYAKFLSSQVAVSCIMFLVFSAPDIYSVISNNMTKGQFAMNMAERFAGTIVGGISGSLVGKLVGNIANPFVGGVVGFAAGTAGGMGASYVVNKITHLFREDDSVIISRLFTAVLINTAIDYTLSPTEQNSLISLLENDKKRLTRLQKKLINSKTQVEDIKKYLIPKIQSIILNRAQIRLLDEMKIRTDADEIIENGDFNYD